MHDHSKMEKMHSKHHSMSHTSAPIGVMGSMHHSGFMISLKQGLMKMNGNIFDGKNISNSKILAMPIKKTRLDLTIGAKSDGRRRLPTCPKQSAGPSKPLNVLALVAR